MLLGVQEWDMGVPAAAGDRRVGDGSPRVLPDARGWGVRWDLQGDPEMGPLLTLCCWQPT